MPSNLEQFRRWLPVIVVLIGVLAGYVNLSAAVKSNSLAIDKQARAMSRMTDLMVADARHDSEIESLRRDMLVLWQMMQTEYNNDVPE
jgi:hypothetical protein